MSSAFDLTRLIHPISVEVFEREYWEKKPLVVKRQVPDYYMDLLSLADVDHILSTSSIRSRDIRVMNEGEEFPLRKFTDRGLSGYAGTLESLYAEYRGGSTIVIQFLHERWKPLMRLCQSLATDISASFQVNVYLTPPRGKGLLAHYDTHDVFVLQTEGSKHWRLFEWPIVLPLKGQPYRRQDLELGEPMAEFDLHQGDIMYIPRGYIHDAVACDSTSLHLTVGVHPITWASVLLGAVESLMEVDPRFRESLPTRFVGNKQQREVAEVHLAELFNVLRDQIDSVRIIGDATQRVLHGRRSLLDGHLLDLESISQVNLETRVRRRPEILWRLSVEEKDVCLSFNGKIIRMPSYMQPFLQYITEAEEFSCVDLSNNLDDTGKLVLIGKLLQEGFLTICRSPD